MPHTQWLLHPVFWLIFKYKVKFSPGSMKKGKAWPTISDYLTRAKIPPVEAALIKLIPDSDVIQQLPTSLQLNLGAGGSAFLNKGKGGAKGKGGKGKKK